MANRELALREGSIVQRPPEVLLQQRATELSFGTINAQCHGISTDTVVVEARNYINECPGVSPITCADGDAYLAHLAAVTLGQRGECLSFPLLHGQAEYYEAIGITHSAADLQRRIHEVNPRVTQGQVLGHPYTNLVDLAYSQGVQLDGALVAATFPTPESLAQLHAMGTESFQRADHEMATKAFLREKAQEYGLQMTQGGVVRTPVDVQRIVQELREQGTQKVWIKLPFASGGDGVIPLSGDISEQRVMEVLERLSQSFDDVFTQGNFGATTRDELWPRGSIAPHSGIVIERDVQDELQQQHPGCSVDICSNALEVDDNGEVRLVGEFEQITDEEGNFYGSRSVRHDGDTQQMLDRQNAAAARFVRQELNHAGIMGTDYALIKDTQGNVIDVRFIEINLRDPISWSAQAAARKVYASHGITGSFINTNLQMPRDVHSMRDILNAVEIPGVCSGTARLENGLVVPLAVRSLSARGEDGISRVVAPSRVVKSLILGRDEEHTQFIRSQLMRRGI